MYCLDTSSVKVAFLAFPEMLKALQDELLERGICSENSLKKAHYYGDLVVLSDWNSCIRPYWAKAIFYEPKFVHFESIKEASDILRGIQRNWAPYFFTQFRRGALLQEKLPYIALKPKQFPFVIPQSPIGIYTLLDKNTLLYSAKTEEFLPGGNLSLIEDHENPPSRAYLKLQESLSRIPLLFPEKEILLPQKKSRCLDAGACPGGWTWVLRQLGADVLAIDRAPLADSLMNDSHVEFMKHDAFTLPPAELGKFDWVFSDVICYPERLYKWVTSWIESGNVSNMICTIKMQGKTDWSIIDAFANIPHSVIRHLNYNKHELTWFYSR